MSYKGLLKMARDRLFEEGLEAIKSDLVIDMMILLILQDDGKILLNISLPSS